MAQTCNAPPIVGTGGAKRDRFGGRSQSFDNLSNWPAQLIASRYNLTPSTAQTVAAIAFGGAHV